MSHFLDRLTVFDLAQASIVLPTATGGGFTTLDFGTLIQKEDTPLVELGSFAHFDLNLVNGILP